VSMRQARFVILAFAAACAASFFVAIAASAAEIVNKNGEALVKNKFEGKGETVALETVGGKRFACKALTAKGTVTSRTEAEETVTLSGCKEGSITCTSEGSPAGDIIIELWVSLLLRWGTTTTTLTMSTQPLTPKASCESAVFNFKGSYLAPIGAEQENKLKTTYTLAATQKKGVQAETEIEHEKGVKVKHILEVENVSTKVIEQAAFEGSEQVKFEEEAEFR
jgi:hypothetical protein